jgi:hypothetical protein
MTIAAALLAGFAAGAGLLSWQPGPGAAATSVRGEAVVLWGLGPYRFEAVFFAAGFRGQDIVTLALASPALLVAAAKARPAGHPYWMLLAVALLAYVAYVYATMSLGAFYNELFLLYVAAFSAGLFALGLALHALGERLSHRWETCAGRMPRRRTALLLTISGVFTAVIWIQPLISALLAGTVPPRLFHATTKVTEALDLAIVVPSCLVAAVLVWRGAAAGYLFAVPLLGLVVMLFPTITASTVSQLLAGTEFTLPEILGPIGGFLVFGAAGVFMLGSIGKALRRGEITAAG